MPPVIRQFFAIFEAQYNKVKRIDSKSFKKKRWSPFHELMGKIIGQRWIIPACFQIPEEYGLMHTQNMHESLSEIFAQLSLVF